MKLKASTSVVLLIVVSVIFFSQSCKKESGGDPPPGGGGSTGGNPTLPSTPYNYAGALDNMPAYYKGILTNNPEFDNTPANNPITNDGATLGRVLFYDKSLSANNTISCGSCHHQDKAFVDGLQFSKGFEGGNTRRNSMSLLNIRFFGFKKMFWDLRTATLEDQVLMPIQDHIEMGMPSLTALVSKLSAKSYYPSLFQKAFGSETITSDKISKALAQFIRSIVSYNSKFDVGIANNFSNFTAQETFGMGRVKATCGECHNDVATFGDHVPTFFFNSTPNNITNNGLDEVYADNGFGEVTGVPEYMGFFKVPSLRNIELTAPYMHDGRFTTLEQVVSHYQSGVKDHPNLPIQLAPGGIGFPDTEKEAMIAFLKTLTDRSVTTDVKYSDPFK